MPRAVKIPVLFLREHPAVTAPYRVIVRSKASCFLRPCVHSHARTNHTESRPGEHACKDSTIYSAVIVVRTRRSIASVHRQRTTYPLPFFASKRSAVERYTSRGSVIYFPIIRVRTSIFELSSLPCLKVESKVERLELDAAAPKGSDRGASISPSD